jgi:energy-coupling factor transporter ATP-binding protein EcfA2
MKTLCSLGALVLGEMMSGQHINTGELTMTKDLTFKEVCKFLKEEDGSLIDAVDKLLGAAIVLSPVILGPAALPILGLLGAKGELTKLGKSLFEKVIAKKEADYLSRMERMRMAYGLICFTAFFEALDRLLPDNLRKKISLQPAEKNRIVEHATRCAEEEQTTLEIPKEGFLDVPLPFPHPVASYEEQMEPLGQLYNHMAKGFQNFVDKQAVMEEVDEETTVQIRKTINELPETALKYFEAQYLELARIYPDFCIWSRLHEHKTIQGKLKIVTDYQKYHASLLAESEKKIDVGFDRLHETVSAIPNQYKAVEAANVVEGLRRHYEARINDPIIEDKYEPEDGKPALTFPKISEAFIPQSYSVLLHTTKDRHLENEETWKALAQKSDLGAFILSYLSSPYSVETPMLILGHPGSGKSLLTKVLSARLMSESYTPIRVPLREVDADLPIEDQIGDMIQRVTGHSITSWANFSGQFDQRPLIIFLDGYDELLQASGKVFAGFLKTVQQFQQREAEQGRPVRVIVTSRIALIGKAAIPPGSTVIRLLEFTEDQRNAWIQVWNRANIHYFESCKPPIQPFELPTEKKILELAEQPLLLLMLALYDLDDNSLRQHKRLDRAVLYDNLLRRFIKRERSKNAEFNDLRDMEQQDLIDREMRRLGVAAIGMYNRRKLHIHSAELDSDLRFFNLEHSLNVQNGRPITQADMLLGSFFFIHKSKAGQKSEGEDHIEGDTAFEFLHNTFGEFLTADFILRFAFQETETLHTLRQNKSLLAELQRKIQEPDGLVKEWFACLMYAPLYSRPLVLEMLREWTSHLLRKKGRNRRDFLDCLDEILQSQIGMILKARNLPSMLRTDDAAQFADLPLMGHVAIYTLNLIILRAILDKDEFVFDESCYGTTEDTSDPDTSGARPWDKLAHIWRSWFSLDNLNGLTAILSTRREDSKVLITSSKGFQVSPSGDQLETVLNVASALADNITAGLAGLLSCDSRKNMQRDLAEIENLLEAESIHLRLEFLVRRLRQFLSTGGKSNSEGDVLVLEGFFEVLRRRQRAPLVGEFLDLVTKALQLRCLSMRYERVMGTGGFLHPQNLMELMMIYPEVAIELLRLAREFGGGIWIERYV